MTSLEYLLIGLLVGHLAVATFVIVKTVKTDEFSKKQKVVNVILIILIPFVWALLVYYLLKPEPGSF